MNTISTVQTLTIDETHKPYAAAFAALEAAGLDGIKVARYCETYLSSACTDETRKVSKSANTSTVTVKWAPNSKEGGKTTVKVAGATYTFGDSAPARFVQVLTYLDNMASMFCPVDDMRIAEAIVKHFQTAGLARGKEASKEVSAPVKV